MLRDPQEAAICRVSESRHISLTLAHPDSRWDRNISEPCAQNASCRVEAELEKANGFAKVSQGAL